jgi:hypothetical protein
MDRTTVERLEQEVKGRFPEGAVQEVLVLEHDEHPAIEPGRIGIRVVIPSTETHGEAPPLEAFHQVHRASIKKLGRDLSGLAPNADRLEFSDGLNSLFFMQRETSTERPNDLTPVMARLGPADLETLDTLIAAGISPNRAEAIRWSLARIRERPAFAKLRDHSREIENLKGQF